MKKFKTYAEYLWRKDTETGIDLTTGEAESGGEMDKSVSNVTEEPLIQPEVIKGSTSGTISCDTEQTEIRNEGEAETMTKPIEEWELVDWAEFFNGFHEQTDADAGICLFCRHNAVMRNGIWYCNHNERN